MSEKRKKCKLCNKTKRISEFYINYHNKDKRDDICKSCLKKEFEKFDDVKEGIIHICKLVDVPFLEEIYDKSMENALNNDKNVEIVYRENKEGDKKFVKIIPPGTAIGGLLPTYLKNIKLPQYRGLHFGDEYIPKDDLPVHPENPKKSDKESIIENIENNDLIINPTDKDKEIEEDCIRLLDYDPFREASKSDRVFLFNELINYLDEDTLNDGFKLSIVLEIVQSLNQLRKINIAINRITGDPRILSKESGTLKQLVSMKKDLIESINKFAKDNGISVNNRGTNKTQGKGTLTQLLKELKEKGIEEAKEDLFDVKTCEAMKQILDISNQSILNQINWDETDDKSIIYQQRELIKELEEKVTHLEEELRLAYIKLSEVGAID
jgi:hypothetical protein